MWEQKILTLIFYPPLLKQKVRLRQALLPPPKEKFLKILLFIDEQISNGRYEWQKTWLDLRENIADDKNTKQEDLTLRTFGEKNVLIRRTMKQTSKILDYAIEYQEGDMPTFKTVSRQDFGRMFRRSLKISRTPSDSPK